jgi:hypothetical protein
MLRTKKIAAALLVILMLIPCIQPALAAEGNPYADIDGHWAKDAILRWSDIGIIRGSGGRFRPDDPMTRGELATLLNLILSFPASDTALFSDTAGKWYENGVNALAWQGVYITEHGQAHGDRQITREEAVMMIARAFLLDEQPGFSPISGRPSDYVDISHEYGLTIVRMMQYGFVQGMPDGKFMPKSSFTRAEVVKLLDNMIDTYITEPGDYGSNTGQRVVVAAPDVTLDDVDMLFLWVAPSATGLTTLRSVQSRSTLLRLWTYGPESYTRVGGSERNSRGQALRRAYDDRFAGGYGFEWSPYLIENQAQLELLHDYVGSSSHREVFQLSNDIALAGIWEPIGGTVADNNWESRNENNEQRISLAERTGFFGTLDGGGYTISGLNVNVISDDSVTAGLFGALLGTVRNLTVMGRVVAVSTPPTLSNEDMRVYAGGIAGVVVAERVGVGARFYGSILDCVSYVDVSATGASRIRAGGIAGFTMGRTPQGFHTADDCIIAGSRSFGTITASETASGADHNVHAGGIVGFHADGVIRNCSSNASVTASGGHMADAGGIVGRSSLFGTIIGCFASGTVSARGSLMQNNAGGIAGTLQGGSSITRCFAAASVSASGDPGFFNSAGGLMGSMYENSSATDSVSAGHVEVEGPASVAGLVGRAEGALTRCYTAASVRAPGALNDYRINGLVGTVRGTLNLRHCGVFNVDSPHFVNGSSDNPEFISIAASALFSEDVYINFRWDFTQVWTLPSATDSYRLPILRGSYEMEQKAVSMPANLG